MMERRERIGELLPVLASCHTHACGVELSDSGIREIASALEARHEYFCGSLLVQYSVDCAGHVGGTTQDKTCESGETIAGSSILPPVTERSELPPETSTAQ